MNTKILDPLRNVQNNKLGQKFRAQPEGLDLTLPLGLARTASAGVTYHMTILFANYLLTLYLNGYRQIIFNRQANKIISFSCFKNKTQNNNLFHKTKQNKTKQNKTKQNKTKQNKTKQIFSDCLLLPINRVYGEREKTVAKSRCFATRKFLFAFAWRKIAKVVCDYPLFATPKRK